MPRFYTVQFNNVSISAVQDLFLIQSSANMAIQLCEVSLFADSTTTLAQIRVLIKRLAATVTAGTGGTAVTPGSLDSTDAGATFTARANDVTTRASSSGATTNLFPFSLNTLNSLQFLPPPEYRISAKPNEALVIGMEVAPGSATAFDGYAVIAEVI